MRLGERRLLAGMRLYLRDEGVDRSAGAGEVAFRHEVPGGLDLGEQGVLDGVARHGLHVDDQPPDRGAPSICFPPRGHVTAPREHALAAARLSMVGRIAPSMAPSDAGAASGRVAGAAVYAATSASFRRPRSSGLRRRVKPSRRAAGSRSAPDAVSMMTRSPASRSRARSTSSTPFIPGIPKSVSNTS